MKLKKPYNHIAGLGFFAGFISFPLNIMWETFEKKNGYGDIGALRQIMAKLRRESAELNPLIGCTILAEPIFFDQDLWIPNPPGWSNNIVRGKTYDTAQPDGHRLWEMVQERISNSSKLQDERLSRESAAQYGKPTLVMPRLGQGAFRALVTNAYSRRCAITGESTLPVLEAAHLRAHSESGPNVVANGMLMRSDFHRLFDNGLVTVTPKFRIEVSDRIKSEWYNGKAYYRLHGSELAVIPRNEKERPDANYLRWHNENIFDKV